MPRLSNASEIDYRLPPRGKIVQLLKALCGHKSRVSNLSTNFSERLKQTTAEYHIDAKALRRIAEEIRMEETKRVNYVRNLNHYRIIAEEAGLFQAAE